MTTFSDIKSAIADDLDDTSGEYAAQISAAVIGAIRYCERAKYYFNQTRDKTFTTESGRDIYDGNDLPDVATLVQAQEVLIEAGGQALPLDKITAEDMEVLAGTATAGQPTRYSYFAQQMRLFPTPDATYTIRLQLSPYRLVPLANEGDTNAWLSEAYDLVKARAKYILHKDTLKDANLAAEALNDYNDQHGALRKETDLRNGTGFVRPTDF